MKKKRFHKRKLKQRRRNAGPSPSPAPRRQARVSRAARPDWRTTLAALAGGAGSAALGGLVVNQEILSPEAVGIGMIGLGGATAYFAGGNTRVVGNSVAAAGAGQLALALMAKRAIAPAATLAAPSSGRRSIASGEPPRKNASGGVVVDLFRDAHSELVELDDAGWSDGDDEVVEVIEQDD